MTPGSKIGASCTGEVALRPHSRYGKASTPSSSIGRKRMLYSIVSVRLLVNQDEVKYVPNFIDCVDVVVLSFQPCSVGVNVRLELNIKAACLDSTSCRACGYFHP
jgi:hypothetical protein